jgi:poly-beta-1,6-N-acetyl-D-glucosamine synthase
MRRTLDSVARQSCPPTLWVIVDDGSRDDTGRILEEYARNLPYLRVVKRKDRGQRSVGPGVVDAFYAGLETVELDEFEYVCKLDLDLELPSRYFELLISRMEANPRLGTCSGKPYFPAPENTARSFEGPLISEACGDESSVGMTKFYRVECFRQIGGFVRGVMWDAIDCHRCRMLGWIAASWDDPELRFVHLRPIGSSQHGIFTGRMRAGAGQWFMGTSLAYMTASALFRMTRPPLLLGGAAMLIGYLRAMIKGEPRYLDPEFQAFIRRYQRRALLRGKSAATAELNRKQAASWRPPRYPAAGGMIS